jgi:hypothetical protein
MSQFWNRKVKQKKKAEPNIEFVSPYPLEDCVWQLQNFPGVGEWFPIKTRVEMSQVDDETWAFKIHKTYFNVSFYNNRRNGQFPILYFKVQAGGHLRRTKSLETLVIGEINISKDSFIVNAGVAIMVLSGIVLILQTANFSLQNILFSGFLMGLLLPLVVGIFPFGKRRFIFVLKDHLTRVLGR